MIRIQENISLKKLNTFGIDAKAKYFCEVTSAEELQQLINDEVYNTHPHLILGGGSNVLFTRDFNGLVIKSSLKGIRVVGENKETALLQVASGENWHTLVLYCVQHDLGGIENLSLIPGTVGASPIQNIGAYGVEIKDVVQNVNAISLLSGNEKIFSREDCHFGYRESVFKEELKDKYFISGVTLRLTRTQHHINIGYGAIQDVLKQRSIDHPTIKDVSDAVIHIRQSKLPDPAVIGNAGSFFKNPTIDSSLFKTIQQTSPAIPSYPADNDQVKVPAGWLIEQCGWKGKRFGNIGVHPQQALVLVNYSDGNGGDILDLARKIQASVKERFGVVLNTEVNIV